MKQNNSFKNLIDAGKLIVLDGGLSNQLEAQGCNLTTSLWSAELLLNNPQAIIDAHLAYLNAGAQIITSSSYQASIEGFMSKGLSESQAEDLILISVKLAEKAIENFMVNHPNSVRPLIAASIGPYGAYLADGSEYTGHYGTSNDELMKFHSQRLRLLDQSRADILACETIPSYQEAKILVELLNRVETPAWISFSCSSGQHINDGTDIEQVARLFVHHSKVLALGINCTAPEYVSELIDRIKSVVADKAIVVYPNAGEDYDANTKTWLTDGADFDFCDRVGQWYQQGAQIIGGCCRIGPEQIKAITDKLS